MAVTASYAAGTFVAGKVQFFLVYNSQTLVCTQLECINNAPNPAFGSVTLHDGRVFSGTFPGAGQTTSINIPNGAVMMVADPVDGSLAPDVQQSSFGYPA